jgi:hypothetical protein
VFERTIEESSAGQSIDIEVPVDEDALTLRQGTLDSFESALDAHQLEGGTEIGQIVSQ